VALATPDWRLCRTVIFTYREKANCGAGEYEREPDFKDYGA